MLLLWHVTNTPMKKKMENNNWILHKKIETYKIFHFWSKSLRKTTITGKPFNGFQKFFVFECPVTWPLHGCKKSGFIFWNNSKGNENKISPLGRLGQMFQNTLQWDESDNPTLRKWKTGLCLLPWTHKFKGISVTVSKECLTYGCWALALRK